MSLTLRRAYSTSSTASASQIAAKFLQKHTSQPARTIKQFIDANQSALFASTIPHPAYNPTDRVSSHVSSSTIPVPPAAATPLPPCYHLAYLTPGQPTCELGADGTDTSYNPEAPFTRRMWAGGELHWKQENPLRIGEEVTERTTVRSAAAKRTKMGEEMVVVGVEKEFSNAHGAALVDKRNWIFRPAITTPLPLAQRSEVVPFPKAAYIRDFVQSPTTLFRFSALTFNAHKIHYSKPWCQDVEGHRDLVVHGPLNLILMVELWRDVAMKGDVKKGDYGERSGDVVYPKSVVYRATHPLYTGEKYRICLEDEDDDGVSLVRIVDSYGNTCMKGTITSF